MAIVSIDAPVQPSEDWRFGVDFTKRMLSGSTVASVDSVTVKDSAGTDKTADILVAASSQVDSGGKSASARFHGFADGQTYVATFKVTLSTGEKREADLSIPCTAT